MTERERLIELLQEGSAKAGEHLREATKMILAEKGHFNSRTDFDHRNIYEIEADHLLANGVIVTPCKVGDTVYLVHRYEHRITEHKVDNIYIGKKGISIRMTGLIHRTKPFQFGRIFFTSREEAEAALKERGKQ